MKVLVTGGAGFIGSHLVEALLALGHEVRVVDDFSTGRRENVTSLQHINIVRDSVCGLKSTVYDYDLVYHLAADANVMGSMSEPLEYVQNQLADTQPVLDAARRWGVNRVVFASSCAAGGGVQ